MFWTEKSVYVMAHGDANNFFFYIITISSIMRGEDWDFRRTLLFFLVAVKCDITYEHKIASLAIMQKFSFLKGQDR